MTESPDLPESAVSRPDLQDCWAKTDKETGRPALTVRDHCRIVGAVAEAILKRLAPALADLPMQGAATVAALHDIGKISPGFQRKCPLVAGRFAAIRSAEARHAGLHAAVEYVGELQVIDPAAFRHAVATGIGPAKAFGFGMLCLAPLDYRA